MKPEIKYGIFGGLAITIWETLEYLLGIHGENMAWGKWSGTLFILVPGLILFLGLKARREELGGFLTLRQGIKSGFLISLVFAGVASFFMYFYLTTINPTFTSDRQDFQREMVFKQLKTDDPSTSDNKANRLSKEAIPDQSLNEVLLSYWILRLCGGLLLGLAITIMLRKDPPPKE